MEASAIGLLVTKGLLLSMLGSNKTFPLSIRTFPIGVDSPCILRLKSSALTLVLLAIVALKAI